MNYAEDYLAIVLWIVFIVVMFKLIFDEYERSQKELNDWDNEVFKSMAEKD